VVHGCLQIVVLDKLDYCASVKNLDSVIDQPNVKVGGKGHSWCRRAV
jgi:dTDP-D-glucose 4,6-dehydratase